MGRRHAGRARLARQLVVRVAPRAARHAQVIPHDLADPARLTHAIRKRRALRAYPLARLALPARVASGLSVDVAPVIAGRALRASIHGVPASKGGTCRGRVPAWRRAIQRALSICACSARLAVRVEA